MREQRERERDRERKSEKEGNAMMLNDEKTIDDDGKVRGERVLALGTEPLRLARK
jgi:hypothetical protein